MSFIIDLLKKGGVFVFHQGTPKTSEHEIKSVFINFSVFGAPDETLALVFGLLHQIA